MQAADPLAFAPPPEPGRGRALGIALLAHAVLAGALTWGVAWKRDAPTLSAEAELWSPTVQQAAPKLEEAPPPPPPPPAPKVQEAPPPPVVKDADIALQKQRKAAEEKKKQDVEREKQKKLEAEKLEKAEAKKKQLAEQKRLDEQKKREEADKLAKAQARDQADAKRAEAQRQENLKRMQGLAGATGGATATGTAQRSSGPSDSYGGRIRARVKPNIVFSEDIAGNPVAEVEVRMAPDGTITSRKIMKSSGNKAWDDAVLRALDRTEILPRDTDGRVHSPLLMEFRPKG